MAITRVREALSLGLIKWLFQARFEQHVQLSGWFDPWTRYLNYEDVNFDRGSEMNAKPMSTLHQY